MSLILLIALGLMNQFPAQHYAVCRYKSARLTECTIRKYTLKQALRQTRHQDKTGQRWLEPEPPMPKGWKPRGPDDQWPGTRCWLCGPPGTKGEVR